MMMIKKYLKNELSLPEVLKAAPNLVYNFFSLLYKSQNNRGPVFLTWVLTDKCQLKCKHCLRESIPSSLSKKDKLNIAKKIADSSAYWISITGGEPFIVPELMDIVKILKRKNKKVTITTNGFLLDNFLKDLIDVGLDAIHLSVDSHKREVHDFLRDCPGLFDKIVKIISEIKIKRKKKPLIKLRCTISKANYLQMSDYVKFWQDKVDSIHFQPIVNDRMNRTREKSLMFVKEDEKPFRDVLLKLQQHSIFRNKYYDLMPEFIFNRNQLCKSLNYKCLLMASSGIYLLPNGDATVCYGRKEYVVGDILTESIVDIWAKKNTMDIRKKIVNIYSKSHCKDCFCWGPNTQFNLYLLSLYNFFNRKTK
ncbi:MAG: radical SAM protein [Candidatus Omnitrophica bacterium]|nr:radical SAM protein [Candidatus Omnitrophota bacterium]